MEESSEKNERFRLPAVTVCAYPGWVNPRSTRYDGFFKQQCQNETTAEGFGLCIKNKTFSFKDLVVSATHGTNIETRKNLSDFNLWTWDMTVPVAGRCYTLDYNVPVGIDVESDTLMIELNTRYLFVVVLHETTLFAMTTNRLAATTYIQIDAKMHNGSAQQLCLEAVKWKRLNQPEQPCNPSPNYNFTKCVIESKAKQVGCTLPWNKHIPGINSTK